MATLKELKVYIDPGHGGTDPGAVGAKSKEKDIVLSVATKLNALLKNKGVTTYMSRTSDTAVSLDARCSGSNTKKANIFVSIHCNSAGSIATGTETFYQPGGSTYENKLATEVNNAVVKCLGRTNRGVKTKDLAVLRNNDAWGILVELLFINNPDEETILTNSTKQQAMAQAIYDGLNNFVNNNLSNYPIS